MSFFDEVFRKLFPSEDQTSEVIHESLVRSATEVVDYQRWMRSEDCLELMREVQNAYYLKKNDIDSQLKIHLLISNYSNGFAISYNPQYAPQTFQNLFDFLKDQVLGMGYNLVQGDRRVLDRESYEETIEKWYLKPRRSGQDGGLIDQRFGNVVIEHIAVDRNPSFIRLMVNIYQDRLYTKALSFDDFIDEIFTLDKLD